MANINREQLINNINTLVETSNNEIKVVVEEQEYWLLGIEYNQAYLLATDDKADETFVLMTESLFDVIVKQALSQVNLFELLGL